MNKKATAARLLSQTGLRSLLGRALPWSGVLVLNYHRIGDGNDSKFSKSLWSASAEDFADQVRFCKSHLDMITPDELPRALASARGRYGMITFDDGYRDNYEVAFPILKSAMVPATFFITTGFIDVPCVPWWDEISWMVRTSRRDTIELPGWFSDPVSFDAPDRQRAVRTLFRAHQTMPAESTGFYLDAVAKATGSGRCGIEASKDLWMNWDMLREMRAAGMVIGGHTVTHLILAQASRESQRAEITGCARRLAQEIGEPIRHFSYPAGKSMDFSTVTRDALHDAGVRYAFSYYGGFRRFSDWDDYDIRRVPVESEMMPDWFCSIISMPDFFA